MDIKNFIEKFAEAIEIEDTSKLTYDTKFRELDEWDSLAVLNLNAFLDEEYDIQIESNDLKSLNSLGDIYEFILSNN